MTSVSRCHPAPRMNGDMIRTLSVRAPTYLGYVRAWVGGLPPRAACSEAKTNDSLMVMCEYRFLPRSLDVIAIRVSAVAEKGVAR
jgi:hypothetical protein